MDDKNGKEFQPYIHHSKKIAEITVVSVVTGILLAVVFGAANAYLGLRVGMTISSSIPSAIVGMGVIRFLRKKDSILEGNMIQTIGSAGEALAGGTIFTLPVFFLWAAEWGSSLSILEITLISLAGGILGVLFMHPLRRTLIVKEHDVLPYPEGTACAQILLAGEKREKSEGSPSLIVFAGMGAAAVLKFLTDGLHVVSGVITIKIPKLWTEFSVETYPALVSVGYICGLRICSYMFAGGILTWLVLIPAIMIFGENTILFPGAIPITEIYTNGGAQMIWSTYIRYIGAGAVAASGFISLAKDIPLIAQAFVKSMKGLKTEQSIPETRTNHSIKQRFVFAGLILSIVLIAVIPSVHVDVLGAILVLVFAFFFSAVASRIAGIIGSTNTPVSGMVIATLLISTLLLKVGGYTTEGVMLGAISIGAIVSIATAIATDISQDLKTGYILGATPFKQQVGEIIGVLAAGTVIGLVLFALNKAWGFGSAQIPAPQAMLMKMIVEGIVEGNLPWMLVIIGAFITVSLELMSIPSLLFTIGLYLPLELSAATMLGGLLRFFVEKKKFQNPEEKEKRISSSVLCCSGMIAGEGIIGIFLAALAVIPAQGGQSLGNIFESTGQIFSLGDVGGILSVAAVAALILRSFLRSRPTSVDKAA